MSASSSAARFKLVFFVPPQYLPDIKTAIFAAGAGRYADGKYTEVCFVTPGIGQFRPSIDAAPAIGQAGRLEEVGEVRCETLITGETAVRAVVEALKSKHPYEVVAYDVYRLEDF